MFDGLALKNAAHAKKFGTYCGVLMGAVQIIMGLAKAGRIERLFGTLKQKLDQLTYSPLPHAGEGLGEREQLNRDLAIFKHWYNRIRPHQNLNGNTPAEAWNKINPYAKPPKTECWFQAWDGLLTGYELKY